MRKGFRHKLLHAAAVFATSVFKFVTAFPVSILPRSDPVYGGDGPYQSITAVNATSIFKLFTAFPMSILRCSPSVYCGPVSWQSIVFFCILNYGTYVVTIKSFPGDKIWKSVAWTIAALLVLVSGILRGCLSISRGKVFFETDFQYADRADALCVLARSKKWKPRVSESIQGCRVNGTNTPNEGDAVKGHVKAGVPEGVCRVTPKMEYIHGQIIGFSEECRPWWDSLLLERCLTRIIQPAR